MRKLVLKMSISVDGFLSGPNGEIDWLLKSLDTDVITWLLDTLWQADVHIMGRRTFHDMAAYYPTSSEPYAAPMNEIPKVVFSRNGLFAGKGEERTKGFEDASRLIPTGSGSSSTQSWAHATVAQGELAEEIARLKQQAGKIILAHGGAHFAQSLARSGCVDEYRLLVHPLALGNGLPLFSGLTKPVNLRLVSATAFGGGVVGLVYRAT